MRVQRLVDGLVGDPCALVIQDLTRRARSPSLVAGVAGRNGSDVRTVQRLEGRWFARATAIDAAAAPWAGVVRWPDRSGRGVGGFLYHATMKPLDRGGAVCSTGVGWWGVLWTGGELRVFRRSGVAQFGVGSEHASTISGTGKAVRRSDS